MSNAKAFKTSMVALTYLQFSVRDQRSSESDTTDVATEEEGSLDHSG